MVSSCVKTIKGGNPETPHIMAYQGVTIVKTYGFQTHTITSTADKHQAEASQGAF